MNLAESLEWAGGVLNVAHDGTTHINLAPRLARRLNVPGGEQFASLAEAEASALAEAVRGYVQPRSQGGDLPWSRRCHAQQHGQCRGAWTAYPDDGGPCECPCHTN